MAPRVQPTHRGHNEPLTDDERKALTLHHLARIEQAQAAVKAARDWEKTLTNKAVADLGAGVKKDFKELVEGRDREKLQERVERTIRVARWRGLPVGAMGDLFTVAPTVDVAREAGKLAGVEGQDCRVPDGFIGSDAVAWTEGWHEGQALITSGFQKLHLDVPSEQVNEADTSDPPFVPPADPLDMPEPPVAP